jgi:predicted small lipoprotein YifL
MKKKILLIMLAIVTIISLTGCGIETKNEVKDDNDNNKKEEKVEVDESLFKINNIEFHLDNESAFKEIKYTISKDFKEANMDKYIQYNYYQEDSTNLLFFRIFYYQNKDINYALKDLGLNNDITFEDGKTDNISYKLYVQPRDDGGTIHFYFINKDSDLYVLNYVSKYDIKEFESKVLKTVKF